MAGHAHDCAGGLAVRPPMLLPETSERTIRELTWEHCGIVRERAGLQTAIRTLERTEWSPADAPDLAATELRNMHQVASLIARCALWREESRGAHFRTDFPDKSEAFLKPSRISRCP
jgi:L-aspartate oxidase